MGVVLVRRSSLSPIDPVGVNPRGGLLLQPSGSRLCRGGGGRGTERGEERVSLLMVITRAMRGDTGGGGAGG